MSGVPKIGDWGFVVGNDKICPNKWKASFPNNWFGKVIDVSVRYSRFNGKKLPAIITIRCYRKKSKPHIKTTKKYFSKYGI